MTKLNDPSPRTGVYTGDLRYGRLNGTEAVKGRDFPSNKGENLPILPLVLQRKRDPRLWTKDERVKEARKQQSSQHSINYIIENFHNCSMNARLIVGKHRL